MSLTTPEPSRSVLITGCSSGIGLAAARQLQHRGYQVFASARKNADVKRLQSEGLNAVALNLDCESSIQSALNQVFEQTGGTLYGLFNNGGFGQAGAVEDCQQTHCVNSLRRSCSDGTS